MDFFVLLLIFSGDPQKTPYMCVRVCVCLCMSVRDNVRG